MKSERKTDKGPSSRQAGADEEVDVAPRGRSASTQRRRRAASDPVIDATHPANEVQSLRNSGTDQLNNRIFFRLFQLGNELQRQAVQQLGITTVQWAVLGALSQQKFAAGMPMSDLGEYLVVTRQNLDGVLKRLERDGLAQRIAGSHDKRERMVRLTPYGQKYWKEILQRIFLFYDQASSNFSFDERVTLVHHLNELSKNLAKVELPRAGLPKRNGG
jgi:DNA-binding MarR family transcriptional regulator